jgi:Asp-tRNA(Asn)/Glu-tRNA(Gln) amidotransferase A subunit family amidase
MKPFQTINELSKKLALGEFSAMDLRGELLRAAQTSPFSAFSELLVDTSLVEATASDRRRRTGKSLGPLDGIPIAIKDLIDTTPAVCKAGLQHLSNYRPTNDARVVAHLRNAGAVVLGVTETDPGAFSTETPQVTNPLSPERTVGGSSGGAAAAVAAGLAVAAIGTDTGGSIRIPAACCSIYGFKPTWGRVDDTGVRPLARSLDHVGPLALNVCDLQILQSTIDINPHLPHQAIARQRLQFATCFEYFCDADDIVKNSMSTIVANLEEAGTTFSSVALPLPDDVLPFHMINLPKEASLYHDQVFPIEWPFYPEIARSTIVLGKAISPQQYEEAERARMRCSLAVNAALEGVDAIMLPTMPMDAPFRHISSLELGGRQVTKLEATIRYTALFNQSGHPVVSMPGTLLPDGRALSIQLVGRRGGDDSLLMIARHLEQMLSLQIDYSSIIAARAAKDYHPSKVIS